MRNIFRRQPPPGDVEMKGGSDAEAKRAAKAKKQSREYSATEHLKSPMELAAELSTSINPETPLASEGLTSALAAERLLQEGKNRLSPPKKIPEWLKFLLHFTNLFMVLLNIAGVLSIIAYALDTTQPVNLYLGIILFVVVLVNVTIAYLEERTSSNVMKVFSKMLPLRCIVIRDGVEMEIPAEDLVRGDVVKFGTGDKVPADMRVVLSRQAKVECSSITGESVPVTLTTEQTHERPTESRNLVFNGSLCLSGEAVAIVYRTGDKTLIGEIAQLAGAQGNKATSLQKEVNRFVWFITILSIIMGIVFFIVGMVRGNGFISSFVNGFIVIIIANVPCGLPTTVTSVIALAAKKMAKKNVYLKRLDCVETLGSTSLVASDKTGTLTRNLMTVVSFWYNEKFVQTDGGNTLDSVLLVDLLDDKDFEPLLHCAALCNRARYMDEGQQRRDSSATQGKGGFLEDGPSVSSVSNLKLNDGPSVASYSSGATSSPSSGSLADLNSGKQAKDRPITGDASDTAIFRFVNSLGIGERIRRSYPKIFEIPFNSTNKFSVAIVDYSDVQDDGKVIRDHVLYLKGAPEIILDRCGFFMKDGKVQPMTEEYSNSVKQALRRCGLAGQRVLAFSKTVISDPPSEYSEEKANFPMTGLTFLGLVSLIDPPRANVPKAVLELKRAHIKVTMVTGDHPITAEAIARQVNIIEKEKTVTEVATMRGVPVSEVSIYDKDVGAVVLTGTEIAQLTDEQWEKVLKKKEIVFARTTPAQKLEIVERNQALGHVVAVTGDGVNDSPALKAADVGVAMGTMGSDVSREAADIVLITDDFAAILDGVRVGRVIFDNLKKTIAYTLVHLPPEMVPIFMNLAAGLPFGLNAILILCIDLGTEVVTGVAMSYEKAEPNVMKRRPRDLKKDRLVSFSLLNYAYLQGGLVMSAVCVFAYVMAFQYYGIPLSVLPFSSQKYWNANAEDLIIGDRIVPASEQVYILAVVQSAWFVTMVTSQFYHIWFVRTRKVSTFRRPLNNIVMIFAAIIAIGFAVILVYVPFLQPLVGTADLPGEFWAYSLIFGAFAGLRAELVRLIAKRWPNGITAKYFYL